MNQDSTTTLLHIEVAFATAERQSLVELELPVGSTVQDAVSQSGLCEKYAKHISVDSPVGIWGRIADPGQMLEDGDRVEIYRRLQLDPREARRILADQGRSMNQGEVTDESET